jgi:hypothetical protein
MTVKILVHKLLLLTVYSLLYSPENSELSKVENFIGREEKGVTFAKRSKKF